MKDIRKILVLLVTCGLFIGAQNVQAQASEGTFRVGAHLGFGTDISSLGIGARGDYAVTDKILIAPDFMYYFGDSNISWFDINFNGNYLFEVSNPDITPYVLAGLNIAIISVDYDVPVFGEFSNSFTEVGFNLGGGADFLVGTIIVFGELRVGLSSSTQFVFIGGVKFPLN